MKRGLASINAPSTITHVLTLGILALATTIHGRYATTIGGTVMAVDIAEGPSSVIVESANSPSTVMVVAGQTFIENQKITVGGDILSFAPGTGILVVGGISTADAVSTVFGPPTTFTMTTVQGGMPFFIVKGPPTRTTTVDALPASTSISSTTLLAQTTTSVLTTIASPTSTPVPHKAI